ncbi:MAG: putative Diguanylate kinase [Frankiales bacterium]|nr:putative Diguanylate kinase [Frankiales bacterium]
MGPAVRRQLSVLVSGGLVVVIGGLGLVAGHSAGDQARQVHRQDRQALQKTLAGLVEQYVLVNAAEVADDLKTGPAWSGVPGDRASTARLQRLATDNRSLDVGAVLVSAAGQPLAAWTTDDEVPSPSDEGWTPLRATAAAGSGVLPLSGVLTSTGQPMLAMGLPVRLGDGTRGLVIGLWLARSSGLQQYVAQLTYGRTGHGYVVDGAGRVVAGPDTASIGRPLPDGVLPLPRLGRAGITETRGEDDGTDVTSYAPAGRSGWTALTVQDRDEFEGALARSSRLVEALVVALLLIAGAGLVVQNRKREAALRAVALHDELTGLYNRRGWHALAEHELARARRQRSSRVLLFVDLDGLKQVNDQLGHREGDRAIAAAAAVLSAASRSSDLVGRLGGDEFVLLLGEDGRADVARARVIEALDRHNARSADGFELRLSLGAEVWFPDTATPLAELVRRADADMYADKQRRPDRSHGVVRPPPREAERAPVS